MDEIGRYDVPAEIDYILSATGAQKIQYVGHSMGGLVFFIAMSSVPEYNNKISLMVGIAPAVYIKHLTGALRLLAGFGPITEIGNGVIGYGSGEWPSPFLAYIAQLGGMSICQWSPVSVICKYLLNIGAGASRPFVNDYPKFFSTNPSPMSTNQIRHFQQMIKSGNFEHFSYGPTKNLQVYGTKTPPLYYLKDATAPVGLFYGKTDNLVPPKDLLRLASELPNNVYLLGIGPKMNHLDFISTLDVNEVFNKPAVDLMLRY